MTRSFLFTLLCAASLSCQAGQSAAAAALDDILREADLEIVHAEALPDGVVDIIFGVSVNDYEHMQVVEKLRAHPDVKDVIARSSPRTFCNF